MASSGLRRFYWWPSAAVALGVVAGGVLAQPPDDPSGPAEPCRRTGRLHRMFHHTSHVLHDHFIGAPENFVEPPLGTYVKDQMAVQVARADTHRFMLYRSDFLPGTAKFSPTGASRFNLMFARTASWPGPVVIEWTPDEPGLADARRETVLATYQRAGQPILADRVVIGPSPYPGGMGVEAAQNYGNILSRSAQAAQNYSVSPQAGAFSSGTGANQ